MNTFSERLKEERNRLGFNQTEFASIGGVQKLAQINYEAGKRSPDAAYLSAIAEAGADVQYILTGTRTIKAETSTQTLTPQQQALLGLFDALSQEHQKEILQTAEEKKRLNELEELVFQLKKKVG